MVAVCILFAATTALGDEYYDLGEFHCAAHTDSADAQLWFDRGMAMCYAFNHEEAARMFSEGTCC